MVAESFREYLSRHYTIYICSDSLKQTDRIRAIFEDRGDNISFTAVERTLHEGFADDTLRICIFTDHQLFDRFHKYNLKSDKARSGKVAFEPEGAGTNSPLATMWCIPTTVWGVLPDWYVSPTVIPRRR